MSDDGGGGGGGGGDDGGGGADSGGCDSGACDNNYSSSVQVDNDYSGIGSTISALGSTLDAVHQIESTKDTIISSSDTAGQYQDSNEPSRSDYQQGYAHGDTYNPLYYNDNYHQSRYVSNYTPLRRVRESGQGRDGDVSDFTFKIIIGLTMAVIVVFIVFLMNK